MLRQLWSNDLVQRIVLLCITAAGVIIGAFVVSAPLSFWDQALFGLATMAVLMSQRSVHRRSVAIFLSLLATIVSTRYLYWRTTETLVFDNAVGWVFGIGLYLAELYAWLMLFFGFLQTLWPLERSVRPLKESPNTWPTVDILIPTYNESLVIVRDTVLGALSIDYPRDKVKVYLLDDGRREEFRAFAEEAGIGYIIRPDNKHAKAGNLNNAIRQTDGELITIFDCDHVATRAFLQLTVGWFLEDPKLSMIQTPHHFYSPDPFERNLEAGRQLPNEGELFYGPVQEGNDLWNAAFFCGSCAVLRRSALDEIGGFATETVTEDAHTALKLQRHGWNTAYLNIRLAAGLATERLALHVGQRMRWARGMTQILRRDNPMFGPGLSIWQRLCYLSAMMHFQFALPRIVFLTAPLVYLLLGQSIIAASPELLLVYALPHLFHSIMTTRRIQGRQRLTFWGEIYETVLAFHLAITTIVTFFKPSAGKFNVTQKGGLLPTGYFDSRLVRPHIVVAGLLLAGCAFGVIKLAFPETFGVDIMSLVMNIAWASFSLIILLCAIAVGRETPQVRLAARIDFRLPATIFLEDGHTVACETRNLSMGGVAVMLPDGMRVTDTRVTHVELPCGSGTEVFPVEIMRNSGSNLGLRFLEMPLFLRRELVKAILGRSDAWTPEKGTIVPPPVFHSVYLMYTSIISLFRRNRDVQPAPPRKATAATLLFLAAAGLTLAGNADQARAQETAQGTPTTEAPSVTSPLAPPATPNAPEPIPAVAPLPAGRQVTMTLKDLGASNPLRLIGVQGESWLPFSLRKDEVVTAAKLTLALGYSPSLIPELSHLSVFINGELTGSVQLIQERSGGVSVEIPINPALFLSENQLNLRFIAHYTRECEDPLHSTLWAVVSNTNSKLELTLQHINLRDDLANLPAPFLDVHDMRDLSLPFVIAPRPSSTTLKAAALAAGYFGSLSVRDFGFPVVQDRVPEENAVVLAMPGSVVPGLTLPDIKGPTLAVVPNPASEKHKLLLIMGRDENELLSAATTLAVGAQALSGPSSQTGVPQVLPRVPYDAPRWVPSDRPVKFGEFVDPRRLQGVGLYNDSISADFRTAPDLFTWGKDGAPMTLRYRYPNGVWLNRELSRLDVGINNRFLKALPTTGPSQFDELREAVSSDFVLNQAEINIPPYEVFGQNQLQFVFDLKANKKGECESYLPSGVRTAIDPDSTLDFSGIHHFARFPNIGFFVNSSFPFTRMANLAETAVLIAEQPTPAELEAFLVVMGRAAASTGIAATDVTIQRNGQDTTRLLGRDILIIGTLPYAASLTNVMAGAPFRIDNNLLRVDVDNALERAFSYLGGGESLAGADQADKVLVAANDFSGIISFRSPFASERVVVGVLAAKPAELPGIVYGLRDTEQAARIGGDLTILANNVFTSYSVGETFWRGELPTITRIRWYLSDQPLLMVAMVVIAMLLLTIPVYLTLRAIARRRLRSSGD